MSTKELFKQIRKDILSEIKVVGKPKLAIVQIVGDLASDIYIENKIKTCKEVGIECEVLRVKNDEECTFENIREILSLLAKNKKVAGIMLQLPLPKHLQTHQQELLDTIPFYKDVDGLSTESVGRLWSNAKFVLAPATATAVMKYLERTRTLRGLRVGIVNRSALIGKPLAKMLLDKDATVEILHSKSPQYSLKDVLAKRI